MFILLGLFFIVLAIIATTYLALQRQEIRKRASGLTLNGDPGCQGGIEFTCSQEANPKPLLGAVWSISWVGLSCNVFVRGDDGTDHQVSTQCGASAGSYQNLDLDFKSGVTYDLIVSNGNEDSVNGIVCYNVVVDTNKPTCEAPTATRIPFPINTPTPAYTPAYTQTTTPIPNTCGASDCGSPPCAPPATCQQVASSPTRNCSCQFPTSTPTPVSTTPAGSTLSLALNLEGFTGTSSPVRNTEPVTVMLRSVGTTFGPFTGTLTYSATTRHFETTIPLDASVQTGDYAIYIKPASYLSLSQTFGTIHIVSGTATSIPFDVNKKFLACNMNNDNSVEISDVNQMYTDLANQGTQQQDSFSDITRDGFVDIFDYNYCVANFGKTGEVFQ
jgi:hypothetical protein